VKYKLRYVLPAVNLVFAALLLVIDDLTPMPSGTSGGSWAYQLCNLINLPASLLRNIGSLPFEYLTQFCSPAKIDACYSARYGISLCIFSVGVGLPWYTVGYRLETKGNGRSPNFFIRVIVDLALISLGVLFGLIGIANAIYGQISLGANKASLLLLPYGAWSVATILAYGRDLIRCLANWRSRRRSG